MLVFYLLLFILMSELLLNFKLSCVRKKFIFIVVVNAKSYLDTITLKMNANYSLSNAKSRFMIFFISLFSSFKFSSFFVHFR